MTHANKIEWNSKGEALYRVLKVRKCTGIPGYSGGCAGTHRDDYGSLVSCPECGGRGKINYWKFIRVPEFDAPRPADDWTPDWIEGAE